MEQKIAIIGDLHGNYVELLSILSKLGIHRSVNGKWVNPNNYQIIQLGDIIDYRGENPEEYSAFKCIIFIRELEEQIGLIALNSNHNNKFYRWLNGNKVKIGQGLENTSEEFNIYFDSLKNIYGPEYAEGYKVELRDWVKDLPDYHIFKAEGHTYVCVHAFFKPQWLNNWGKPEGVELTAKQWNGIRERMLYGIRNTDDERWLWWEDEEFTSTIPNDVTIIAGHYHEVNISHPRAKVIDATPHVITYLPLEDRIIKSGE